MSGQRLRSRAPSAHAIGTASLMGHRMVSTKSARMDRAKRDCHRTGEPTDVVHGVLFSISRWDTQALDLAGGAIGGRPSYRRAEVTVLGPQGLQRLEPTLRWTKERDFSLPLCVQRACEQLGTDTKIAGGTAYRAAWRLRDPASGHQKAMGATSTFSPSSTVCMRPTNLACIFDAKAAAFGPADCLIRLRAAVARLG
jgi:hypothetical protein